MSDLRTLLECMTPEQRAGALVALDTISRPMRVREIEGALRLNRVTKSRATALAGALKGFHVIALIGPE